MMRIVNDQYCLIKSGRRDHAFRNAFKEEKWEFRFLIRPEADIRLIHGHTMRKNDWKYGIAGVYLLVSTTRMKGENMKKLFVLLVLVSIPMMSFADFQIGPTALYNIGITEESSVPDELSISNFTFGADARLNFGMIQGSAYGLVTLGDADLLTPTVIDLYLDIGICLDILFVRVGFGIGPNFAFNFYPDEVSDPEIFEAGANVKLTAEVMLGDISVGLVYLMDANLTPAGVAEAFEKIEGHLGVSVLFKLF